MRTMLLGIVLANCWSVPALLAAEITGKIDRVEGSEVHVSIDGDVMPPADAPLDVVVSVPGIEQEARVARGRVLRLENGVTIARIDRGAEKVKTGQKVRIPINPADTPAVGNPTEDRKPVWTGIQITDLDAKTATASGLDTASGAIVLLLVPNGPAARAGIRVGDIIVRVEDQNVATAADFQKQIQRHVSGNRVRVTVHREKARQVLSVTLASMPSENELARLQQLTDSPSPPDDPPPQPNPAPRPPGLPLRRNRLSTPLFPPAAALGLAFALSSFRNPWRTN
ncbi:MAG: PDZ domain-containing protein [Planctomycetota bacterium]